MAKGQEIEAMVAQAELVRQQLDALQIYYQQLAQLRDNVIKSLAAIEATKSGDEVIVYLDPGMNAAMRFKPSEEKVLIHIGLNIYAKLSREESAKILEERRAGLEKAMEDTAKRMRELKSLYDRYQEAIGRSLARAERR